MEWVWVNLLSVPFLCRHINHKVMSSTVRYKNFTHFVAVFIVFRGLQFLAPNKFILVIKDANSTIFVCLKLMFDKSECGTGWAVALYSWVYGCDCF